MDLDLVVIRVIPLVHHHHPVVDPVLTVAEEEVTSVMGGSVPTVANCVHTWTCLYVSLHLSFV